MAERGLRLKLGAFVAGTLVVLAGLVVFFGRAPELFSNKVRYAVLYPEAPGVGPGTPIRKSGVRIGEVKGIDLDSESGQVRLDIRVDPKYRPRKSEDAIITRGLLNGDTAVDFITRTGEDGQPVPRGEEWPPGSEIPGIPPITPRSLLTPASGIMAQAQQSLDKVARAFERLENFQTVQPKLERALDEASETFKAIRGIVPDAKKTLDKIQNFIGSDDPPARPGPVVPAAFGLTQPPVAPPPSEAPSLKTLIREVQDLAKTVRPAIEDVRGLVKRLEPDISDTVKSAKKTFDGINEVLTPENKKQFSELLKNANGIAVSIVKITDALSTMLEAAEKTIKNVDMQVTAAGGIVADVRAITRPLSAKSEALVTNVTETAEQLGKAVQDIRQLLQTFGKGNGSLQKLLSDPAVYQNIDEAAGSLARVMARAEKITRDLEVFADKIARRPELIGVGGAVRPSAGLKESPNAPTPAYRPDWPPSSSARPGSTQNWLPPTTSNSTPPPVQGYPPR